MVQRLPQHWTLSDHHDSFKVCARREEGGVGGKKKEAQEDNVATMMGWMALQFWRGSILIKNHHSGRSALHSSAPHACHARRLPTQLHEPWGRVPNHHHQRRTGRITGQQVAQRFDGWCWDARTLPQLLTHSSSGWMRCDAMAVDGMIPFVPFPRLHVEAPICIAVLGTAV